MVYSSREVEEGVCRKMFHILVRRARVKLGLGLVLERDTIHTNQDSGNPCT